MVDNCVGRTRAAVASEGTSHHPGARLVIANMVRAGGEVAALDGAVTACGDLEALEILRPAVLFG